MISRSLRTAILIAVAASLAGCSHHSKEKAQFASDLAAAKTTQIGVNTYLWEAALDTLSFMPLLQTDSNGGVIVTDWYVNPNQPAERMKMTVTIFDADLRADAVRVSPQRQVLANGNWVDEPVQASTAQKLEDIILTKARDMRRATIAG